ncbi:MAG: hypothetical protein IAF08_11530 [Rhizobacter sp.]|nr:hypothetical protein [Chlorobiales bacterium]
MNLPDCSEKVIDGQRFMSVSVCLLRRRFALPVNYNFTVTARAGERGLWLTLPRLFLFHPPVFFAWQMLRYVKSVRLLFLEGVFISIENSSSDMIIFGAPGLLMRLQQLPQAVLGKS